MKTLNQFKKSKLFTTWFFASMMAILSINVTANGQVSPEKRAKILKKHPSADLNNDGILSNEELQKTRNKLNQQRKKKKKIVKPVSESGVVASFTNLKYGNHKNNVFDIWIAESERPTPLVIYIHGGGFIGGDKSKIYESKDIDEFLKAGVSIATINYRFRDQDDRGILACLLDSKRALQYLRTHAQEYHIDKQRIACYGGSAGAGTSLWLATHDEMADLDSNDPVLRESTRIVAAGAMQTQSTYDLKKWFEIFNIKGEFGSEESKKEIASIHGKKALSSEDERQFERNKTDSKELDILGWMSPDDPPIWCSTVFAGGKPKNKSHLNHHPLHIKTLKEQAKAVGMTAVMYAEKIGIEDPSGEQLVPFLIRHLKQ